MLISLLLSFFLLGTSNEKGIPIFHWAGGLGKRAVLCRFCIQDLNEQKSKFDGWCKKSTSASKVSQRFFNQRQLMELQRNGVELQCPFYRGHVHLLLMKLAGGLGLARLTVQHWTFTIAFVYTPHHSCVCCSSTFVFRKRFVKGTVENYVSPSLQWRVTIVTLTLKGVVQIFTLSTWGLIIGQKAIGPES